MAIDKKDFRVIKKRLKFYPQRRVWWWYEAMTELNEERVEVNQGGSKYIPNRLVVDRETVEEAIIFINEYKMGKRRGGYDYEVVHEQE